MKALYIKDVEISLFFFKSFTFWIFWNSSVVCGILKWNCMLHGQKLRRNPEMVIKIFFEGGSKICLLFDITD